MRKTILAALLLAPSLALATPERTVEPDKTTVQSPTQTAPQRNTLSRDRSEGSASGNGMTNTLEGGHVTGPGTTPVDTHSRGPINDIDPGRGTADTHQSKNPPAKR